VKFEEILPIVEKVVSKQLRDTTIQTERDELRNVALVGILEAAKKGQLNPAKVGTIAKREIINFKLGSWNAESVPKGSRNYLRKQSRLATNVVVDIEGLGSKRWREERLKTLRMTIEKWKEGKHGYERLLVEKLMDGLTANKAYQELWDDLGDVDTSLDATYDIVRAMASELQRLLDIQQRRQRNGKRTKTQ